MVFLSQKCIKYPNFSYKITDFTIVYSKYQLFPKKRIFLLLQFVKIFKYKFGLKKVPLETQSLIVQKVINMPCILFILDFEFLS